jgi:hypothetical protein
MARLRQRAAEAGLREYLLEDAVRLRDMYGHVEGCWKALTLPVDQLIGGEAYTFPRYQLPYDHPLRRKGHLHEHLRLTECHQLVDDT